MKCSLWLLVGCAGDGAERDAGSEAGGASTPGSGSGSESGADGGGDDGIDDGATASDDDPGTADGTSTSTSTSDGGTDAGSDDTGDRPGECGDNELDPGEACDDWDRVEGDGCNTDCTISGSVLWSHTQAGGAGAHEDGYGVAVTPTSEAFVAGDILAGSRDVFLRQYTAAGGLGFTTTLDGSASADDAALALVRDGDELYVAGYRSTGGGLDLFVANYDTDGNAGWTASYDDPFASSDAAHAVAVDLDGNVIVAGYATTEFDGQDVFVQKYGPTGSLQWSHGAGTTSHDHARGVAADFAGNVIVVGFVGSPRDAWLRKLSPGGDPQWSQTVAGADGLDDQANAVTVDGKGEIVVAGRESTAAVGATLWLARYDPAGAPMWSQTFTGSAGEGAEALGVVIDASGDIAVVGYETIAGLDRVLVRKYTADGELRWSSEIEGAEGTSSIGRAITVGPDQHLWVAGGLDKGVDGRDVWLAKIAR